MATKVTASVCLRFGTAPEKWVDLSYDPDSRIDNWFGVLDKAAEAYVTEVGVRSPYGSGQYVDVSWRRYKLQQGKVVPDGPEHKRSVRVPEARMTEEQFNEIQAELLAKIPKAFHGWASYFAYDRGHSAGREEIIIELRNLVSGITEPIEAYRKELMEGVPA